MNDSWNNVNEVCCKPWLVLPTVYSDALSYAEQLDKFCYSLNKLIENNNILPEYIAEKIKEYISSGAIGEVVREILANYILNVKYPPKGITPAVGDGSADDTEAIQGCIDYAAENGGVVYFPYGSYLAQPLTMKDNVSLFGFDRYSTKVVLKGGATKALLNGNGSNLSVCNLTLDGNSGIQVNDVNVVDMTGSNLMFNDLVIRDGYKLFEFVGDGHLQMTNVVFGNAVENCFSVDGNVIVQTKNLLFTALSKVGGVSVVDIKANGGNYDFNSVAKCDTCMLISGNDNKVVAMIGGAAEDYVDTGEHNNVEIVGHSQKEYYSGDVSKSANNEEVTLQGTKSLHVVGANTVAYDDNSTESVDGNKNDIVTKDYTHTVKGTETNTVEGSEIQNYNGGLVQTVKKGKTENIETNKIVNVNSMFINTENLDLNTENPLMYKDPSELDDYFKSIPFLDRNGNAYKVLVYNNPIKFKQNVANVVSLGVDNTGVTDASEKLNEIIANGGVFFIPIGTYKLSHQLVIPSNTHLIGEDRYKTILKADANLDLVYHTICSKNAENINARLARNNNSPKLADGYPSVDDVCTYYVTNISIENLTVDGNWQNRNLDNWNKTYTSPDGKNINREPGTNIELQRVEWALVKDVESINGPQHNINVRGGAYSYAEGINFTAQYPSANVVIDNCHTVNERYDDGITTHDSEYIIINDCVVEIPNNANGVYNAAISNGIEIDDGSRFISVLNCHSMYGSSGFQAKGHSNTPSAHDVLFFNCLSEYNHHGFTVESGTSNNEYITTKGSCYNVYLLNCTVKNDYAFSNESDWQNVSHPIALNNVKCFVVKGFKHITGVPTGLSNIGATQNSHLRCRGTTSLVNINDYKVINALVNNTTSYFNIDGTCRNFSMKDVFMEGFSGKPAIGFGSSSTFGFLIIDGFILSKRNDSDSIGTISSDVQGTRTNMILLEN